LKTLFNLTTSADDLGRFASREEMLRLMDGFDGVELMVCGDDARKIVPRERVFGIHMASFPFWLDFWRGNERALIDEFGSLDECERYYGGSTREALLERFRVDLLNADRYHAEYVVFHVSEASIGESFTGDYRRTDENVIDAACELLNALFGGQPADGPALLLENLWQPGLTFTRPEMTQRLLDGVRYPNKGFVLDTGHLFHTNESIQTQSEGLAYINRMLDRHGALCEHIRGMHLHQSVTGAYCRAVREHPPALADTYEGRSRQMFEHAFKVDLHRPFTCPGVGALIHRIGPEYLTLEFITENIAQHRAYLREQRQVLAE